MQSKKNQGVLMCHLPGGSLLTLRPLNRGETGIRFIDLTTNLVSNLIFVLRNLLYIKTINLEPSKLKRLKS